MSACAPSAPLARPHAAAGRSDKLEYAARTIRPKIHRQLDEVSAGAVCTGVHTRTASHTRAAQWLVDFPEVRRQEASWTGPEPSKIKWGKTLSELEVDRSVPEVSWAKPGPKAGREMLDKFLASRLKVGICRRAAPACLTRCRLHQAYGDKRNDPTRNAQSNVSGDTRAAGAAPALTPTRPRPPSPAVPLAALWRPVGAALRAGGQEAQVSVGGATRSCAWAARERSRARRRHRESVDGFIEELLVRRELAENYCFYNEYG